MAKDRSRRPATPPNPANVRTALLWIGWAIAVALLGFAVGVELICWPYDPPRPLADAQPLCAGLALLFLLTNGVILVARAQAGLFALSFAIALAAALATCHYLSIDLVPAWMRPEGPQSDATPVAAPTRPENPVGIWRFDERYGYDHVPNRRGVHKTPQFDVTYTIDADRCRVTPTPEVPQGRVFITGCSYTFGHGVEDDECYPAVLAATHWPSYKVQNRAVCGYGTVHAYLVVGDELDAPDRELPSLVIYGMIPNHLRRNYVRKSYVRHIVASPFFRKESLDPLVERRGYPHFELVDGELEFRGLVEEEGSLKASPLLKYAEIALTEAFLSEMHAKCSQKGVPLVIVLLPQGTSYDWGAVGYVLDKLDVPCLDVSHVPLETIPGDGHPSAKDHERIADAIADSFITDLLYPDRPEGP